LYSLIQAAGWPIWLIIIASVTAVGIIGERVLALRISAVTPKGLLTKVIRE